MMKVNWLAMALVSLLGGLCASQAQAYSIGIRDIWYVAGVSEGNLQIKFYGNVCAHKTSSNFPVFPNCMGDSNYWYGSGLNLSGLSADEYNSCYKTALLAHTLNKTLSIEATSLSTSSGWISATGAQIVNCGIKNN